MEEIKHAPVHERHQEQEHRSAYRSKRKGEHGRVLHLALQDAVLLVLRHLIEPRVLAHLSFEKIAPLCFLGDQRGRTDTQQPKHYKRHNPGGTPCDIGEGRFLVYYHAGYSAGSADFRPEFWSCCRSRGHRASLKEMPRT